MYLLHIYRRMWFSGLCETLTFYDSDSDTQRSRAYWEWGPGEGGREHWRHCCSDHDRCPPPMPWSLRENNNNMTHIQAKHVSVAFGTVSPLETLMCPLVCPKLTINLLDPPKNQHFPLEVFTVASCTGSCVGEEKKRGWYTLFAHAPSYLCNLHTTPPHQLLLSSLFVISPSFTQSVGSVEAIFYIGEIGMPHEFYGNWACANSVYQLGSFFSAHAREPGNKANAHVEHSQLTIHKNCKIFTDINQMFASMMCY